MVSRQKDPFSTWPNPNRVFGLCAEARKVNLLNGQLTGKNGCTILMAMDVDVNY